MAVNSQMEAADFELEEDVYGFIVQENQEVVPQRHLVESRLDSLTEAFSMHTLSLLGHLKLPHHEDLPIDAAIFLERNQRV